MTGPSIPASQAASQGTQPSDLHREQLSAMMDGMLSNDESRFLLRRMQHDAELAGSWERWQLYGDALRGQAGRALPADFNKRISRAIAADSARTQAEQDVAQAHRQEVGQAAAVAARRPLLRWGGGAALAASMALAAVMVVRGPAETGAETGSAARIAASSAPSAASLASLPAPTTPAQPTPAQPTPAQPAPVESSTLAAGAAAATLVAAASAGASRESNPGARRSQVGSANTATQRERSAPERPVLVAGRGSLPQVEGFGPQSANELIAKPWPRSLLQDDAGGARVQFNAGGSAVHPSFQPRFAPEATTAPGDGANAPESDAQAGPTAP